MRSSSYGQRRRSQTYEEVDLLINELRAQADCMESVDPRTLRQYDEARDNLRSSAETLRIGAEK